MTRFLLVVFDGLRPDLLGPHTTPNLLRLADIGMRFTRARSVFPSETRVCSASVATGCHPRRHGLVANRMAHPCDRARSVDTGKADALRALEQEMAAPLLGVPTLGEILAAAGRDCAVLSSGTTGQTHVLNPRAASLHQASISAHGCNACSPAGARIFDTLDRPPAEPVARAEWIAEVFRTRFLPDPPAFTVLWLCEPDTSGHYAGLGSAANLAALRRVDAAFGRILDDWQRGPQREVLQIAAASDHGHATIVRHHDSAAALADAPGFAGCTLLAGSSAGIVVPDGDAQRIAALAAWLTRQDWVGTTYADLPEALPGVLPRDAVLQDHARAADLLFTLRSWADPAGSGLPGITLEEPILPLGGGTHGGISAAEMQIVLLLAGSHVRQGGSDLPAGLVDIAPTVLSLLGVPGAEAMDGRVLIEALQERPHEGIPKSELLVSQAPGFVQRLHRVRIGRHVWLESGGRD